MKKKKQKTLKEYAETNFLSEREDDLNELAEDNIIYEESQTGPQEEPTLKEIMLRIEAIRRINKH